MKVLKGILGESKEYYLGLEKEINNRLKKIPKGNIKKRNVNNRFYYYLQYRNKNEVKQKYLGKIYPEKIAKEIKERKILQKELKKELKKIREAIKIIKKTEYKKNV